jgi:SAM-dependent methyltransferase
MTMAKQTTRKGKNRNRFEQVLNNCVHCMGIDLLSDVLVVGGSAEDGRTLHRIGFTRVTLSNLLDPRPSEQADLDDAGMCAVRMDAEAMELADNSYDLVLAHEVLHHCRSPHKALLEMLRVSRRHVILLEPNNSLAMQLLLRLRFPFLTSCRRWWQVVFKLGECAIAAFPTIFIAGTRWTCIKQPPLTSPNPNSTCTRSDTGTSMSTQSNSGGAAKQESGV